MEIKKKGVPILKKIEKFQITGMTVAGFKSFREPTELSFGNPTVITGGNGRGKTSIADAIAFAITGLPFFGERGIDKLHNESNPDVFVNMRFVDETGTKHELTRTRKKNRMTITFDGYEVRQLELSDLFGERDVFLSIFNPLYFIEELGDNGKNLLEMHLPMIPHEAVLGQLSEPVRESLREKEILSPDTYLKNKRAEIRELEEHIIYLNGQRDLAASQNREREQATAKLSQSLESMRREFSMMQEKQYEGMDVSAMQERLVELSARYGEYNQDEQTEAAQYRSELLALREKIARREAEQYQSKYTQAVAETASAVKELGVRYRREVKTFEALVPGTACPTCHRKITEASLPEVQGELKKAAAAILTAGREKQAQLMQLQELDRKSAEVFAQFKTEDLQKWSAEAEELEQKAQQAERSYGEQTGNLRAEIQSLNADLTYGRLSQEEYERMLECREEIKQAEAELGALCGNTENCPKDFDQQIKQDEADIQTLKKHLADVAAYVSKRAEMTFSQLKMNRVEIALYDVVKSTGEVRDIFKFTYGGRRYDRLSLSEKVRAGMEVSELMKRLTGRNYPVFVDNMESIDDLANVRPTGQIIMAKCVNGAPLQVRPVNQAESPVQRAA
jgi:DNA repair exonuclease SbcCD ATPase subunit